MVADIKDRHVPNTKKLFATRFYFWRVNSEKTKFSIQDNHCTQILEQSYAFLSTSVCEQRQQCGIHSLRDDVVTAMAQQHQYHFRGRPTSFDMTRTDSKHFTMMKPFLNKGSIYFTLAVVCLLINGFTCMLKSISM